VVVRGSGIKKESTDETAAAKKSLLHLPKIESALSPVGMPVGIDNMPEIDFSALRKILELEQKKGFSDSTVFGDWINSSGSGQKKPSKQCLLLPFCQDPETRFEKQ